MAIVNFDKVRELIVKSGTVTIDSVEYIGIIDCSKIIGEHDFTYTGDFLIKPFNSGESKIINQNYNNLQNQIQNVVDAQVQEKMGEMEQRTYSQDIQLNEKERRLLAI